MKRLSDKSKAKVIELFNPGGESRLVRGLTIRALLWHNRYRNMRDAFSFARIEGDHLVCLANLIHLKFDLVG